MNKIYIASLLALAGITLSACLDDKTRALGQCEMEAERVYPQQEFNTTDRINRHLLHCMQAAGYEYAPAENKASCPTYVLTEAACYNSTGLFR
jgi:hypothetical protein